MLPACLSCPRLRSSHSFRLFLPHLSSLCDVCVCQQIKDTPVLLLALFYDNMSTILLSPFLSLSTAPPTKTHRANETVRVSAHRNPSSSLALSLPFSFQSRLFIPKLSGVDAPLGRHLPSFLPLSFPPTFISVHPHGPSLLAICRP